MSAPIVALSVGGGALEGRDGGGVDSLCAEPKLSLFLCAAPRLGAGGGGGFFSFFGGGACCASLTNDLMNSMFLSITSLSTP